MIMEPDRPPCIGLVLAGGRSSRMGRDKALLRWHGEPLIEHQIRTLEAAGVASVHVSGDRPEHGGIVDRVRDKGPVGGLASATEQLPDGYLLVVPVDMPRVQPTLLIRLAQASDTAALIHFEHYVLPLRLRLDAASRTDLSALMALPDDRARSLRALAERVGSTALPLSGNEPGQLADCNTPEQWEALTS